MRNRENELQIVTIDEDIRLEHDEDALTNRERLEIYNRYYELEIDRLNLEYQDLNPTIH
ncbi:MAG: hypothetical protein ACD_62C00247G0001 [uncultured bacterium]|nr:MAG: hypothetical protein ACD_62C00247G0001 [uncultured bacterium]HLD44587.1 hypothetical protein [bacterium]